MKMKYIDADTCPVKDEVYLVATPVVLLGRNSRGTPRP
jgi:uncharacterized protein YaiI (UPF0178 family)